MAHIDTSPENWLNDYGDILYRYALVRVRSEATAEDLVQETLLAGLKAVDRFSGKSTARTWLVGILKHKNVILADEIETIHLANVRGGLKLWRLYEALQVL